MSAPKGAEGTTDGESPSLRAVEFIMLCVMLQFYCGPKYLGNMLITLGLYTYFSKTFS